jgi:hypothetical protein
MKKINSKNQSFSQSINSLVSSGPVLGSVGLFALAFGRDASAMAHAPEHAGWVMSTNAAQALEQALIRAGQSPEQAAAAVSALLGANGLVEARASLARLVALIEASHEATGQVAHLATVMDALAHQVMEGELSLLGDDSVSGVRAAMARTGLLDESALDGLMNSWLAKSQVLDTTFGNVQLTQYDHVMAPSEVLAVLSQAATAAGAEAGVAATTTAAAGGLTAVQIGLALLGAAVAVGSSGGSGADAAEADTTKPATLTVSLTDDTGSSASDNVTSSGLLTLGGRESGATLQYSADGSTWSSTFAPTEGSNTVYVRQTDAAGNVSDASQALTFDLDTTAPNTGSTVMTVDRSGLTITLGLNEALVGTAPEASSFAVTTPNAGQATANPVSSVAINGNGEVVLTLTNAFNAGQVNVVYTKPATGAVLEDLAGNDVISFFSGVVADGYIRGAKVWLDTDGDGQKDVDTGIVSNEQGQFFLPIDVASSGALVMVGGVNMDTGLPNTIQLKAPKIEDFTKPVVINPLTTLVQTVLEQTPVANRTADTLNQAQAKVVSSLGLTTGTDLLSFDPISEATSLQDAIDTAPQGQDTSALTAKLTTAVTAQKAAAQVVSAVSLVADGDDTASASTLSALASKIDTAQAGQTLQATLDATLDDALLANSSLQGKVASAKAAVIAITNAASLDDVSQAQAVALDQVAPAAPTLIVAAVTNSLTPEVTIQLDTTSVDGTAVVVGNVVEVFVGATSVETVTLTAEMVATKQVKVTLPDGALGADGDYSVTASITDRVGNQGDASVAVVLQLDTQADAPAVALDNDTGSSKTDRVTNDAALSVTGTEEGASVEYSADGKTWSSTPPAAVAGENTVYVRQTDLAGNVSDASVPLTFTLDTQAAAPAVALASDSGSSANDSVTSDGELVVTGTETGATVEYRVGVDGDWTSSFTATEGLNTIYVRQTDLAGNVSDASAPLTFTLDTQAAAPAVALASDSGSSTNDSVTSDGALVVTGTETEATVEYRVGVDGGWTSSFTATEGLNTVYVRQTDAAGNISGASTALEFTKDSTAPSTLLSIVKALDNVPVDSPDDLQSGAITNDNTPELSGTFEGELKAGEVIEVFDGQTSLGVATVDDKTLTWTLAPATGLANGEHTFTAQAVDAAGNRGEVSAAFALTVDATVPAALASIEQLQDDADGYLDALTTAEEVLSGGSSNDATPLIQGTLTETLSTGEKVLVFSGATLLGEAVVDGIEWSLELTDPLAAGSKSLTATVENAGGNRSAVSDAFVFQLDTTPPEDPVIQLETEFTLFADARPSFSVIAEAGATLILGKDDSQGGSWVDASLYQVVESESNAGQFTFTAVGTLTDGDYALMAKDDAGNLSPAPSAETQPTNGFRIDTAAPTSPVIQEVSSRLTNDTTPTYTLQAEEEGLSVLLGRTGVGGTPVLVDPSQYSVTDDGKGRYTLTVTSALSDGDYGIGVIDAAGNKSVTPSGSQDGNTFRIDSVAPALVSGAVTYDDGFDGKLDVGDTVTLSFNEPVLIASGALDGHAVLAQGATSGYSTTYLVTLGSAMAQDSVLTFAAGSVRDQAQNTNSQALSVQPLVDGAPGLDLAALFAVETEAGAALRVLSENQVEISGDEFAIPVELYDTTDELALGLRSMVWVSTVGSEQTLSRVDLPVNAFFVDTATSGVLALQTLALSDINGGGLTPQSSIGNLTQAATDSVEIYTFTPSALAQSIQTALASSESVLVLPDAAVVYDKADLSRDTTTDFSDTIFVVNTWTDAEVLAPSLATNYAVIAGAYGPDSTASYFALMDGTTALKVVRLDGEAVDVLVVQDEVFVTLADDTTYYAVHLDIANETVTRIDSNTYGLLATTEEFPQNLGTSGADASLESLSDFAYGFAGNDTLTGSAGNDTLIGGLGGDTFVLSAGGADLLMYNQVADSSTASPDVVVGFDGLDAIDVSRLLNGYTSQVLGATSQTDLGIEASVEAFDGDFSVLHLEFSYLGDLSVDYFSLGLQSSASVFAQDSLVVPTGWASTFIDGQGAVFLDPKSPIAKPAAADNPGTPKNEGLLMSVDFYINEGLTSIELSMSDVELSTPDGTAIPLVIPDFTVDGNGVSLAGATSPENGVLAVYQDTISLLSGDNEFHFFKNASGELSFQFDQNPTVGVTDFSAVLQINGLGDYLMQPEQFAVL